MIDFLQQNPTAWFVSIGILGLLVGSFLNVVIYRLPIMFKREWRKDCMHYLQENYQADIQLQQPSEPESFDLVKPNSSCPHCGHAIRAWENIPVISYLFLAGRCSSCKATISLRYPLIELLSAALALGSAWQFGVSNTAFAAILFGWVLIALAMIDLDTQYLPDNITLPVLWLGLILNMNGLFTDLESALVGAVAGYLSLWSIYQLFKLLTGKEGMGYGDFKLLAMLGAWLGWQALPAIIIISSLAGAIIGISLIVFKQHQRETPIPFGPYLAIAGWITLLWGDEINRFYLLWLG